jgi:hypothetical protein
VLECCHRIKKNQSNKGNMKLKSWSIQIVVLILLSYPAYMQAASSPLLSCQATLGRKLSHPLRTTSTTPQCFRILTDFCNQNKCWVSSPRSKLKALLKFIKEIYNTRKKTLISPVTLTRKQCSEL